jgi:hypothetical protein
LSLPRLNHSTIIVVGNVTAGVAMISMNDSRSLQGGATEFALASSDAILFPLLLLDAMIYELLLLVG